MLRIAYLVNTYPRASHSFIRREIQALERLGWQVHRFAMRSDRAALVDSADLAEDDLTEHVLKAGLRHLLPKACAWMMRHPRLSWGALGLAWRSGARGAGVNAGRMRHLAYLAEAAYVAARCKALSINHLHAHFGTNSTTVAMLATALGGPTFSFTTHGPEEFDAPVALSLGDKLHRATFAVAISSFGRSQLCRWSSPADWPRIHIVHCGIEPACFAIAAPLPAAGPQLVAIGRLAEQKGFNLLIDAFAEALTHVPTLHLTIVGEGPLRPNLETALLAKGLAGKITLAGWQDEAGIRHSLAASQALISASFAEGLPVVLMEAMAAGRPVIATSIAGIPELVTPDVGWLVAAGDACAMAKAIRTLAETPLPRLTEMGHVARARAFSRHDVDTEAAKLSALFASTLNG